ncbi:MAG TPA: FecR domain-containing protein [Niabella sp.]|nr:FecR domain-containing protein [Niabella sp.]
MEAINHFFEQYLNDSLSKEEKEYIDNWLAQNENPSSEWRQLESYQKQQFINSLHTDILNAINSKKAKVISIRRKMMWRSIAASVIFLLMAAGWFIWNNKKVVNQQKDFVVFNAKKGQKTQLKLMDGSMVWLNESSTIRYPKTFNGSTREVWLDGEAYFDIFRDMLKNFIVHTGQINTTVLGTAFNIKTDTATRYFAITVLRGKVSVSTQNKQLLGELKKSENLIVDKGGQISKTKNDSVNAVGWLPQDLVFDDLTLAEVIGMLEQRYSKHIQLNNPKLANCRFSGSAGVSASLDDVLKAICAFNNATYHYQDNSHILIEGAGCN